MAVKIIVKSEAYHRGRNDNRNGKVKNPYSLQSVEWAEYIAGAEESNDSFYDWVMKGFCSGN